MVTIITSCTSPRISIMKSFFYMSFQLIFITTMYGKYHYPHFTDKDTEVQGPWGSGENPMSGFRSFYTQPSACPSSCPSHHLSRAVRKTLQMRGQRRR